MLTTQAPPATRTLTSVYLVPLPSVSTTPLVSTSLEATDASVSAATQEPNASSASTTACHGPVKTLACVPTCPAALSSVTACPATSASFASSQTSPVRASPAGITPPAQAVRPFTSNASVRRASLATSARQLLVRVHLPTV